MYSDSSNSPYSLSEIDIQKMKYLIRKREYEQEQLEREKRDAERHYFAQRLYREKMISPRDYIAKKYEWLMPDNDYPTKITTPPKPKKQRAKRVPKKLMDMLEGIFDD